MEVIGLLILVALVPSSLCIIDTYCQFPSCDPHYQIICPPGYFSIPTSRSCFQIRESNEILFWEDVLKECRKSGPNGRPAIIEHRYKAADLLIGVLEQDGNRVHTNLNQALMIGLLKTSCNTDFVWTDGNSTMPVDPYFTLATSQCHNGVTYAGRIWFDYRDFTVHWSDYDFELIAADKYVLCETIEWRQCPSGYISLPSSTSCYKVFNSSETHNGRDRLNFCKNTAPGGRLAFIDTEEKNFEIAAVMDVIDTERIYTSNYKSPLLVGLRRQTDSCAASFVWTDGVSTTPHSYVNWANRQPDCGGSREFCVHIFFDYANKKTLFNDIKCDRANELFLCEAQLGCDPNCHDCFVNGVGKCDDGKCKEGYVFDATTNTCQVCDPNCRDCSTNGVGKCDNGKCKAGYVFDAATNTCQAKCRGNLIGIPSSDTCYQLFHNDTLTWGERMIFCNNNLQNGHLAFIDTEQKGKELAKAMAQIDIGRIHTSNYKSPVSIGLRRKSEACSAPFIWTKLAAGTTGTPLSYVNWKSGQPDCGGGIEFCVHVFFNYANELTVFNDIKCNRPNEYFLCETTSAE